MTFPLWLYIGLGAQLLWVAGNLLDKYLIEKYFRDETDSDEGVGTLVIFSSLFSLLLSIGIWSIWHSSIDTTLHTTLWGIAIGAANAVWLLAYLYAIAKGELTTTVPIFQTIPIFGFFYGFILLGETITVNQFLAACSLVLGSFILSFDFKINRVIWLPLALMLLASATLALEDVLFKVVALDTNFVTSAFWQGIGLGATGGLLYAVIPSYRRQFNSFFTKSNHAIWGISLTNELFDNAATLIFSYAVIIGPVMLVQTVAAYQPFLLFVTSYIIALFFGNYLRENISHGSTLQKLLGIIILTIGSTWLYLQL